MNPTIYSKGANAEMPSTNLIKVDDLLPQTKDDLKHQIFRLTSALSVERSRNKELHRQKLSELKQAKDELERQKERSNLIFKTLDSGEDILSAYPEYSEERKLANKGESRSAYGRYHAVETLPLDAQDRRASSSLGVYSSNSPYVKTITSLQREVHLLRESKSKLEQRLLRIENRSPWFGTDAERGFYSDQSFAQLSYDELDRSTAMSPVGRLSSAGVPSPSRQVLTQLSGDSNSTFIIDQSAVVDDDPEKPWNRSFSAAGSEKSVTKEAKHDRDVKEAEKHWHLQRRVSDLCSQSSQLERRVTALKEENEVLKKKVEEQKTSEEKTKQLKRRNAELASIARRLEDKLRQVQQDSPKKLISGSPGLETSASKQTSHKTKSKERSSSFNDKDRVIGTMRERFQQLLRHHQSIQEDDLMNKEFYSVPTELENVVRVAAKERLQLEKQLVDVKHNPEIEAQRSKAVHLEKRNSELMDEVKRLTEFSKEKEKLEIELMQRRIEVETLDRQVVEVDKRCAKLTSELQEVVTKNTQLSVENSDMRQQIGELEQIAETFSSLNSALAESERELDRVRGEASALQERVQTLEVEIQYLDQAEQKKRQLESEKRLLQEALQAKDEELEVLRKEREFDYLQHSQSIKTFELRIADIEGKYREQVQINESMSNKLKELRTGDHVAAVDPPRASAEIHIESNGLSLEPDVDNGPDAVEQDNVFTDCDTQNGTENGESEILKVFQAMFDYDPEQCSPNEEPEAELMLLAGDYMFVCGDMDEDGFYYAELLNGRQGLVPSNFVRKLTETELIKFYSHINLDVKGTEVQSGGKPNFLDFSGNEDSNQSGPSRDANLSSGVVESLNALKDLHSSRKQGVPDAPVNVQVDSGPDLGCLMVSWLPVTITTAGTSNGARVAGYSVYINELKVKYLPNATGDHVLLEPEDFPVMAEPRITVRTVSACGKESGDSLSAVIPPHILHELNANNNCETPESEKSQEEEISAIAGSPEDRLNSRLQEIESLKTFEAEEDRQLETLLTREKERDRHFEEPVGGRLEFHEQNLPETAAISLVLHQSRDDSDILDDTVRNSVWRKISPKSKLNTTFDASDFASADFERTWKSLDTGGSETVFVKTQSQEILGGTKRSDVVRCLSHTDVHLNSHAVSEHDVASDEPQRTKLISPVRTLSPSVGDKPLHRDNDVASDSNASVAKLSVLSKSVSIPEQFDSPFGDFTASAEHNGVAHNEADDMSSCSELNDNNAVTSKKIRDDLPDSELIDFSDDGGESLMESVDCENDIPVRIFIALFSYDPETMSPNPDAISEELPFREGQIIKIYGEKDQDGFFLGEISHQRGLVPCNMISEVHFNDPEIAAQLLEESRQTALHSADSSRASSQTSDFTSRTHSTVSMMGLPDDERLSPLGEPNNDSISERYVIALYDYDPQELSPNTDVDEELSFHKGDIIKVLGDADEDGFYYGQLNDHFGLIPSNFVKEAPSSAIYNAVAMQNRYLHT